MARLILCFILASHLLITLSVARPVPRLNQTGKLALHGPFVAKAPSSVPLIAEEPGLVGAPLHALQVQRQHRPFDKSIAGGEAILCGLVMAAFAAIVCYIRVTRRRSSENKS